MALRVVILSNVAQTLSEAKPPNKSEKLQLDVTNYAKEDKL